MTSGPGVDHPEEQTEAEVTLTDRGISVSTRVELVSGDFITVRPSVGDYVEQAVAAVGDRAQVFWKSGQDTRSLPAEVISAEAVPVPRWRLRSTGPAEVSQRRQAVRGRVTLPLEIGHANVEMTGETVDFSEYGLRAQCDGMGVPPEAGTMLDLVLQLEDGPMTTKGQVVRFQARGARWLLSIQFVDLPERDGDRLRRRVFQALREERARNAE
jgi:c-di-GMP-binding flagellar brake protein YcgR